MLEVYAMYETNVVRPVADIAFEADERVATQVFQVLFYLGLLVAVAIVREVI
ncbi:MAG: hypothetical protein KKD39_07575 [Candidatus Altiarchaeota archaeon]|nr:hypothetical protein [Candidatus Altiarchaeota archaeon]